MAARRWTRVLNVGPLQSWEGYVGVVMLSDSEAKLHEFGDMHASSRCSKLPVVAAQVH